VARVCDALRFARALKLIDLNTGEDRWLKLDVSATTARAAARATATSIRRRRSCRTRRDHHDLRRQDLARRGAVRRRDGDSFTAKVDQQLGPLVRFDYPIDDSKLTSVADSRRRPSPDGTRIVFTALDKLWIADLPQGRA
jgi:hypothetical protein